MAFLDHYTCQLGEDGVCELDESHIERTFACLRNRSRVRALGCSGRVEAERQENNCRVNTKIKDIEILSKTFDEGSSRTISRR